MRRRFRDGETTGGSDERASRDLSVPLSHFKLAQELARLQAEGAYVQGDRNALTLAKVGPFRLVLVAFRRGAEFDEADQRGTTALQVVQGVLSVQANAESVELGASEIAVIAENHPWSARALADGAVLIHLAWPPEPGSVTGRTPAGKGGEET